MPPKSVRQKMPEGITANLVCRCFVEKVSESRLECARRGEALFKYRTFGRKADKESLYENQDLLKSLLTNSMSWNIDKLVLQSGLRKFDALTSGAVSQCKQYSLIDQAYAVKQMLMALGTISQNAICGSRLAPWLCQLVHCLRQCNDAEPGEHIIECPDTIAAAWTSTDDWDTYRQAS